MRIIPKNIIINPTTQPRATNKTNPQALALVTLLTETNDRRLLMIPTEWTSLFRPFLKALKIKIMPTQDRNRLSITLLEADGTNQLVVGLLLLFMHVFQTFLLKFLIMISHENILRHDILRLVIDIPEQVHLIIAPLHTQLTERQCYFSNLSDNYAFHL